AERLAQLGAHRLEAREDRARLRHALLDVAADVLGGVQRRLLRQVADAQAVGGEGLAQEVLVDAGHDAQQRRLAGAIGAEHADLGAVEEREIDTAQDLPLGRDDLAQILHHERVLTSHFRWGPRNGPQAPFVRAAPAKPGRPSIFAAFGAPRHSRGAPLYHPSNLRCSGIMQRSWTTRMPARASVA